MNSNRSRQNRPNSPTRRRIRATVIALHGTACCACGRETIVNGSPSDGRTFELGHVVSDSNGGEWKVNNFLPICRRCNVYMDGHDWPTVAPMLRQPVDAPLIKDVPRGETNMEAPGWYKG